jgi:hypothetical protein
VSRKHETKTEEQRPPRPTRAQRLAVAGFLAAFGLTIITVLLTGYFVRLAASRHRPEPGPVATAPRPGPDARASSSSQDADAPAREAAPHAVDSGNGEDAAEKPTRPDASEPSDSAR